MCRLVGVIYFTAWVSALLVLTIMGNAKASSCGTSDITSSHAFLYIYFQHHKYQQSEIWDCLTNIDRRLC